MFIEQKAIDKIMSLDDELIREVWVSGTYSTVYFSKQDVTKFMESLLNIDGSTPDAMDVVFFSKPLRHPKTKREIKNAPPAQLKEWLS